MSKRRMNDPLDEVATPRLRDRSSAQIKQLIASLATLRDEFAAYRALTDAAIAALEMGNIVPRVPVEKDEERPPAGNWQPVKEIMFLTGRSNSTIHKWIRQAKLRVYQPRGKRTAILIDADQLPPPWVSRSAMPPDGHTVG
jgi:hypothetical protein